MFEQVQSLVHQHEYIIGYEKSQVQKDQVVH